MEQRAELYNTSLDKAVRYEREGRLLIVAPDDLCGMDTLTRDKAAMDRFYKKRFGGWQSGHPVYERINT